MANRRTSYKMNGYRFYPMRDQDPICDKVKTLLQDEGFNLKKDARQISYLSDVSASAVLNLIDGTTKKPRHSTIGAIVSSLGYKEVFVRDTQKKIDREKAIEDGMQRIREQREAAKKAAERATRR
jgi:hypothetical protein